MKLTLELTNSFARLTEKTEVVLPDNVELNFKSVGYDLSHAFISLKNGETMARFRLTSPFTVPDGFLHAGRLNGVIDAYIGEDKYKSWDILPIKIIETESGKIELYCQFTELENLQAEIVKKLAELDARLKKLEDKHKLIK